MSRKLVIEDGQRERELQLVNSIVMGRDPSCDVSDDGDTLLSRRHAEFSVGPSGVRVRDLGSRNGTFVNGTRIAETTIRSGDVVAIGRLRVRYTDDSPVAADDIVPEAIAGRLEETPLDDAVTVRDVSAPLLDAVGSQERRRASFDHEGLSRFVVIEVTFLAAVVFVAVAAAAVWRTPGAVGGVPAAGGIGWLIPPAFVAVIAACGVAWRINRRLGRLAAAGAHLEEAAPREGVGAIDASRVGKVKDRGHSHQS